MPFLRRTEGHTITARGIGISRGKITSSALAGLLDGRIHFLPATSLQALGVQRAKYSAVYTDGLAKAISDGFDCALSSCLARKEGHDSLAVAGLEWQLVMRPLLPAGSGQTLSM